MQFCLVVVIALCALSSFGDASASAKTQELVVQFMHLYTPACSLRRHVHVQNTSRLAELWLKSNVVEKRSYFTDEDTGKRKVSIYPSRKLRARWLALPDADGAAPHDAAWSHVVRAEHNDWSVVAESDDDVAAFRATCGPLVASLARSRPSADRLADPLVVLRRDPSSASFAYALTYAAAVRLSASCGADMPLFFNQTLPDYLVAMAASVRDDHTTPDSHCQVLRVRDANLYEAESNPRLWDLTFMQPSFLDGTAPRREVCRDAYAIHVFNERFAEAMVERTEEFGNWTTYYRDDPVPTEDIHTEQIAWRRQWTSVLRRHLSPLMNNLFTGTKFESKHQSFIVRYITTGQYELEAHQDESLVTSVVTLSNQFEGGGVTFTRYNCTVVSKTLGLTLFHPGQVTHRHRGLPISAGRRYIFVSFNK
jgi:hypothetical protein